MNHRVYIEYEASHPWKLHRSIRYVPLYHYLDLGDGN